MSRPDVTVREGIDGPPIPVRDLVRRLAALAWAHRAAAVPGIFATVLFQAFTLIGLAGQGWAIDLVRARFSAGALPPRLPLGIVLPEAWPLEGQIALVTGVALLMGLLAGVARFFTRYGDEFFVQACVVDLRQRLYEKLQSLSPSFFETIDTGQVINRVTGDSQQVRMFIQGVMIRSGIALITLAIFIWYMAATHVWLALACVAVYPVQVLAMVRYSRVTKPKYLEQSRAGDRLVKVLQESIAGVRVIRVFGKARERTDFFDEKSRDAAAQSMSIARDQSLHMPWVGATNFIGVAILLGYGGWLVMLGPEAGGIALGTLWVFRGLLDRLAGQAEAIVSIIGEAPESLAGAERVFRLLDTPVDLVEKPSSHRGIKASSGDASEMRGEIEFRDVTFGYTPEKPVLHGVSFKVGAGEVVAVVGPTGSGKSTLLSLISRFHDVQAGQVLIDGVDVRDWALEELRRSIGIVFQEPFLFSNTVGANVAFGAPTSARDMVHRATLDAAAEAFVGELPEGFDTIIGERGVSLSGGQRQRLTIARALLIEPRVLILDDATGSVDALTESVIQSALDERMKGRTTFIVAHRLSTLRRADRIIVLDKGRIVDIGTHEGLMERPGHYRAAALIQLALDDGGKAFTAEAQRTQRGKTG